MQVVGWTNIVGFLYKKGFLLVLLSSATSFQMSLFASKQIN